MKKNLSLILLNALIFTFASCMDVASNRQIAGSSNNVNTGGGGGYIGDGDTAIPGDNTYNADSYETIDAKVEIRHLIEPKVDDSDVGGEYTRKLTIPKNYDGLLYVAGINVSTLTEKNVKVRFKFGMDSSPITIPATIDTAPGLTPQTGVEVLVMDLRSQPFSRVRLLYDLFDYNEYDFGASDPDPGVLTEPVSFNRNDKLFCRGLKLENDPTFTGQIANGCSQTTDVCKFSYVKVVDKGLVQDDWLSPILPTSQNIATRTILASDSNETNLTRCLPDNPSSNSHTIGTTTFPFSSQYNSADGEWEIVPGSIEGLYDGSTLLGDFYYQGPYQATNLSYWQVKDGALLGEYGVFKRFLTLNVDSVIDVWELQYGAQSLLFPLQIKRENLPANVQYMGSEIPGGEKEVKTMDSNGESLWMDGCNERVSTAQSDYNGEHVGACNVTATVEIIAIDDDGTERIIDATDEVKLQLVKPATLDTNGDNVLSSSFRSCDSSSQCGSDSCCINKRCWSKSIVSQCVEDLPTYGNGVPGTSCQSDTECSSLCCNQTTGQCAVHDTLSDPQVLCSKPSGQACIAKEWCMKHPVTRCFIVNTGTDAQGQKTCALRCYTYEEFGDCKSSAGSIAGVCVPPEQPEQPTFNPTDAKRCDEAINPDEVPVSNI